MVIHWLTVWSDLTDKQMKFRFAVKKRIWYNFQPEAKLVHWTSKKFLILSTSMLFNLEFSELNDFCFKAIFFA